MRVTNGLSSQAEKNDAAKKGAVILTLRNSGIDMCRTRQRLP